MKWGVRKAGSPSSPRPSNPGSADHATAEKHKATIATSGVKALSNHELQQLVTRMNLEQQHRNLAGQQKSQFDKGHSHIKKILSVAKTAQEIHGMINSPAGKALKVALGSLR